MHGSGIRVNTIEPRAAVLSEGAAELVGSTLRPDQIETMDEMVEAVVALCDCPPDFTGRNAVSLDLISELAASSAFAGTAPSVSGDMPTEIRRLVTRMDLDRATFARRLKPSARFFADVVRRNACDDAEPTMHG